MMKKYCFLTAMLVLPFAFAGCGRVANPFSEHEIWKQEVKNFRAKVFELDNITGAVTVETHKDSTLSVEAVKTAYELSKQRAKDELSRVHIKTQESDDGAKYKLWTEYEKSSSRTVVSYKIKIPEGLEVNVENVTGNVVFRGNAKNLRATTITGKLHVEGEIAAVHAEAVTGNVVAVLPKVEQSDSVHVLVTTGNVTLYIPEKSPVTVLPSVTTGKIDSDFPLDTKGFGVNQTATMNLNGGGKKINLNVVTGRVEIRKIPGKS